MSQKAIDAVWSALIGIVVLAAVGLSLSWFLVFLFTGEPRP